MLILRNTVVRIQLLDLLNLYFISIILLNTVNLKIVTPTTGGFPAPPNVYNNIIYFHFQYLYPVHKNKIDLKT